MKKKLRTVLIIIVIGASAMYGIWELFSGLKWHIGGDRMGVCIMFEWMILLYIIYLLVSLLHEEDKTGTGRKC